MEQYQRLWRMSAVTLVWLGDAGVEVAAQMHAVTSELLTDSSTHSALYLWPYTCGTQTEV